MKIKSQKRFVPASEHAWIPGNEDNETRPPGNENEAKTINKREEKE